MLVENQVSDARRIVFVDGVIDQYGDTSIASCAANLSDNYKFAVLFATESTGSSSVEYSPSIWHNGERFGICGADTTPVQLSEVLSINVTNEDNVLKLSGENIVTNIVVSGYAYSEPINEIDIYNSSNAREIHVGLKSGETSVFDGSPIIKVTGTNDNIKLYQENCAEYYVKYEGTENTDDGEFTFEYYKPDGNIQKTITIHAFKWPEVTNSKITQNGLNVNDNVIVKDAFDINIKVNGYLEVATATNKIYKVQLYTSQRQLIAESFIGNTISNSWYKFKVNQTAITNALIKGETNIIVITCKNDAGEYDKIYEDNINVTDVIISPSIKYIDLNNYANNGLILSSEVAFFRHRTLLALQVP